MNPQGILEVVFSWADVSGNDDPAPRATSLRHGASRAPRDPDPDPDDSGDDKWTTMITSGTIIPTKGTTKPTRAIMRAKLTPSAPFANAHLMEVTTMMAMETMTRIMVRAVVTLSDLPDQGAATLLVLPRSRRRSG